MQPRKPFHASSESDCPAEIQQHTYVTQRLDVCDMVWCVGTVEAEMLLLSLLLTFQVSAGHTWEQKVIRLYLMIMLSFVALR